MAEFDGDGGRVASDGGTADAAAGEPDTAIRRTVEIRNRRGLHARAAAKFVKLAGRFDATVEVTRDGMTVGGESIMGLMMLAAAYGSEISLTVDGPEAEAAVAALAQLVDRLFDED